MDVRARAGNNLSAAIPSATVYGDVTFTNLDDGNLTVDTDIVAKAGKNGEAGNILFTQNAGDIYVEKSLQADGSVMVVSTLGAVKNSGNITAGKNIEVGGTLAYVATGLTMKAGETVSIAAVLGDLFLDDTYVYGNDIFLETYSADITVRKGALQAKRDVTVSNTAGNIDLDSDIDAGRDINVVNSAGESILYGNLDAGNDILASSGAGMIGMTGDLNAGRDIVANSDSGALLLWGDIDANRDVTASTGGTGFIWLNGFNMEETKNVHAVRNVNLQTESTGIAVAGKVTADTGDVTVKAKTGSFDFQGNVYAGRDIVAEITEGNETSDINFYGTISAERDVVATTKQGNILYKNSVGAGNSIKAMTDKGNIEYKGEVFAVNNIQAVTASGDVVYGANVISNGDIQANAADGNIVVGENILAIEGDVKLITGTGHISVGIVDKENGTELKGNIYAGNDVLVSTKKGEVLVQTSITSENGSVSVRSNQGSITIGEAILEDGRNTVSAKKNIDLYVMDGVITINGHTTTWDGDISVHAVDDDTSKNLVITENGRLNSGRDLTLHTYNGSIEITDDTLTKRNLNVIVDNIGDVEFGRDVIVGGDVNIMTDNGDITMGKRADNGTTEFHTVTSLGGSIDIETGKGNISIGHNATNDPTLVAEQNIMLSAKDGTITVDGKTETKQGDITVEALDKETTQNIVIRQNGILDSARDLTLHTYNGGIEVTDSTLAKRNIRIIVDNQGDITFGRDINVVGDVAVETGTGTISVAKKIKSQEGSVDILTKQGNIRIGDNGPDVETVAAYKNVNLTAESGKIEIYGKTFAETGDVTLLAGNDKYIAGEAGKNIIIDHNGEVEAGRDATMIVVNGDIHVTDRITAGGSYNSETRKQGNIIVDKDITVGRDMSMKTENGSISVGKAITANSGSVTMTTGTGDILAGEDITAGGNVTMKVTQTGNVTVGEADGTGNVKAAGDVVIAVQKGDAAVKTSITSTGGSVSVRSEQGSIRVGEVPAENAILAQKDVALYVADGTITVNGHTTTAAGDITVEALDKEENGVADRNIVITENGQLDSGRDLTMHTYNGGINVTGNTTAKRNMTVTVDNEGDVTFERNIDVTGNVTATTSTGDVTVGEDIKAGENVKMATGTGNITVGADVSAGNDVNMDVESGNITVGSNGKGSVVSGNDVKMTVDSGNVSVDKTVDAQAGSVDVHVKDGDIKIGNNGPDEETVSAYKDVNLTAESGKIRISGKTATETGDITVHAVKTGKTLSLTRTAGLQRAVTRP